MEPILLVLAAGIGSRYGGIKQLERVGNNGETLLDYSCYDALRSGFKKIVFIIRPDIEKEFREVLFDRIAKNADASYVFQTTTTLMSEKQIKLSTERKKPWGTVQAVLSAEKYLNNPFAIINSDDYYGLKSFQILGSYLSGINNDSNRYSLVGYLLKNTMSLKGSVSRGICEVKDSYLTKLTEHKEIQYQNDRIVSYYHGKNLFLTGEETVSMNLFGLTPNVLNLMKKYLYKFWENSILDLKAEYILSDCLSEIIDNGEGSLQVFNTPEKWFGMTYIEDREMVRKSLKEKTESGVYPIKLWEK